MAPRTNREKLKALSTNPWLRWVFILAILVMLGFFLREHLDFLSEGIAQVRKAHTGYTLIALAASLASLAAMAEVMRILLRAGDVKVSRRATNALVISANSWSTTFPGGQAFATVLQFQTMRRWGASPILCSWHIVLSGALATVWLAVLGIIAVIYLGENISLWSLGGTVIIMVALSMLVYWAAHNPDKLAAMVEVVLPKLNRLRRKPADYQVAEAVKNISQLQAVNMTTWQFLLAAFWSLMNWVFDILTLWACVWAVTGIVPAIHSDPNNATLAGVALAFVTSKIVGTIQATPGGLGPVEAALTGTLVAVGMTAVNAFGAVFVYRMISFILVTAIGWVVYFFTFARKGFSARRSD